AQNWEVMDDLQHLDMHSVPGSFWTSVSLPSYYASTASVYQPETESPAITTHQGGIARCQPGCSRPMTLIQPLTNWLSSSNDSMAGRRPPSHKHRPGDENQHAEFVLEKPKKTTGKVLVTPGLCPV
ncbi:hypothetical protein INR49_001024, partial [Caranx melampygus]